MIQRPTVRRGGLAVAMTCVIALTACGGGGDDKAAGSTSAAPSGAAETPVEAVTTAIAPETSEPPKTSVDAAEAKLALGTVYSNLLKGRTDAGAVGGTARKAAFTGQQLKVAEAEVVQQKGDPKYQKPDAGAASAAPLLLSVSKVGSPHKLVIGEAQPAKAKLPELYLAETPTAAEGLRITHVANMLPNRRLQALPAPLEGMAEVPETTKVNGVTPAELLTKYLAYMTYPEPTTDIKDQPFNDDPYIQELEKGSRAYAAALGENGQYHMQNKLVPGSIRALKKPDGTVMVFSHFERMETFTVTNGASVETPAKVRLFNPKLGTMKNSATVRTDVCMVFYMYPTKKAELLAGSEQLVAASGG